MFGKIYYSLYKVIMYIITCISSHICMNKKYITYLKKKLFLIFVMNREGERENIKITTRAYIVYNR